MGLCVKMKMKLWFLCHGHQQNGTRSLEPISGITVEERNVKSYQIHLVNIGALSNGRKIKLKQNIKGMDMTFKIYENIQGVKFGEDKNEGVACE